MNQPPNSKDQTNLKGETRPKGETPRFNRGPIMLVLVLILFFYIGVEITEGLGWLTREDWIADLTGIFGSILLIIALAAVFSGLWIFISRRGRRKRRGTSAFYLSEDDESDNNRDL